MTDRNMGRRLEKEADERGIPLAKGLRKALREDPEAPIQGAVAQAEADSLDEDATIKAQATSAEYSDAVAIAQNMEDGEVIAAPQGMLRQGNAPLHDSVEVGEWTPEPLPKTTPDQRIEELTRELVEFYRQWGVMPRSVLQDIRDEFVIAGKAVTIEQLEHEFNRLVAPAEYARQVAAIYLRNAEKG